MRVLAFGLVASVLTGLFVGQAPILAARKVGLTPGVRELLGPTCRGTRRSFTVHDVIVTFQIAMSLAMLISAALLVQSLRSLNSVDPGFRADNLLLVSLDPGPPATTRARLEGFWRDTLDRVSQIPGVQSVSLAGDRAAGARPSEAAVVEPGVRREDRDRHQFRRPAILPHAGHSASARARVRRA